uniref:SP-RING-type domain-containing protein n=1 Tax=Manihot esculenta TaxID=3983 RepID=A0A2C9WA41_MANES
MQTDSTTGAAMPPLTAMPVSAGERYAVGARKKMSASFANFFRIAAAAQQLAPHLQPGSASNPTEFFRLCLSLARGIDYAVANNEVPPKAQDLPLLLKQVCLRKNDLLLQAAIMVLMISVKNACKVGWFSDKDSQELIALANEIANSFCGPGDVNTVLSDSLSIISTVMSRFYPLMKMGQLLASLEVKPGYGAYAVDFHISKNITHSQQEKIRLFIVQRDNMETSACIVSPQKVNFLLNGKGVERRTNVSMDTGPQIPTNVTAMLKYGTNLLQAVGQFNGDYIIAVAFMSVTPLLETPVLLDYEQSNVAAADPDSDIIEGPSRVSLNCPISYTRIRTPVKGRSCKHLQCCDFSNFLDINSRRPSWRCPHCNQHVCYTDIRVDQNMVKVLKEVGENVADVIISADGSWKAILQNDDNTDQTCKETVNCQKETPGQQEPATSSDLPIVMDLTEDDYRIDVMSISDVEDKKPSQAALQSRSLATNLTMPNVVGQNVASQVENSFWSDVYLNHGSGTSNAGPGIQMVTGTSGITDAVSPVLNRDAIGHGNNNLTSLLQNQISASGNLQQSQLVNAAVNNEYGRLTHIPRHVNRTPVAVQALPVPSQTSIQQQRSRTNLNSAIPNGSSVTSQAALPITPTSNGFNMASNHMMDRQQQHLRSHTNPHQTQQGVAQVGAGNSAGFPNTLNARFAAAAQRAVQITRQPPSVPVQIPTSRGTSSLNTDGTRAPTMVQRVNVGAAAQVNTGSDGVVNLPSEQNWRPTGRMRGSLSGQAAAAYGDLIIQPTQPAPAAAPKPPATSSLPSVPPPLQALLASSRNFYVPQTQNNTQPASVNGNSGTLP